MVRSCSIGECKSRSEVIKTSAGGIKFSTFPKNKARRAKWAHLCGRKDVATGKAWAPSATKKSFVCERHFVTGGQRNDPDHPDYLPSLLLPNSTPKDDVRGQQQLKRFDSKVRRDVLKVLRDKKDCNNTNVTVPDQQIDKSMRDVLPGQADITATPAVPDLTQLTTPDPVLEYTADVQCLPAVSVPGLATPVLANFGSVPTVSTPDDDISEWTTPTNAGGVSGNATPGVGQVPGCGTSNATTNSGMPRALRFGSPSSVPGFAVADRDQVQEYIANLEGVCAITAIHDQVPEFGTPHMADISIVPGSAAPGISHVLGCNTPDLADVPEIGTPDTANVSGMPGFAVPDNHRAPQFSTPNVATPSGVPRVLKFGTANGVFEVTAVDSSTDAAQEIEQLKRELAAAKEKLAVTEMTLAQKEKKLSATEKERDSLRNRLTYSEAKLNTVRLSVNTIYENDPKSKFYTGLSWEVFLTTYTFLVAYLPTWALNCKLSYIDQFMYTLVRLRHNDAFEKLADQGGIGRTTMVEYFAKWIDLLFVKMRWYVHWPDREYIYNVIPPHFKVHFPKLTCIIDCFELFIESPRNLKSRSQVYSSYKSHTTAKYLIGCNSHGAVTYLSKGFGGKASDIYIVQQGGFIDPHKHLPGDQILADRGFTFKQEMASVCAANLYHPHFIKGKSQFTAGELEESRLISMVRIHIERIIGLIKNRFAILQQTIPIRLVKSYNDECDGAEFAQLDKIVTACAILVNLETGIVCKDGELVMP